MNKVKLLLKEDNIEYPNTKIKNQKDIVEFLNKNEQVNQLAEENAYILCLNSKNEIITYSHIAKGGINECTLDFKTIFKTILLSNANKFILVHNHPSGDITPSKQDIDLTKKLEMASKLLDIQLIEHLVVGKNNYKSCIYNI